MKKVIIDNKEFDIFKNNEEIIEASKNIAKILNFDYQGKEVVWMTVMRGGIMFSTELMKHITFPVELDFISSSSYNNYGKVGSPQINYDGGGHLEGKNIIIIDDLIDSGETLEKISEFLIEFKPASISCTAMFSKAKRIKTKNKEYFAFNDEPNGFLVGFGLDIRGFYRNLPYVAIIKDEKEK